MVFPLEVGKNTLKTGGILHVTAIAVAPLDDDFEVVAVQHRLLNFFGQVLPGRVEREVQVRGQSAEEIAEIAIEPLTALSPGQNGAC